MKKNQTGAILIIALLVMLAITGIGVATFSITDTNSRITRNNIELSQLINLANAVLEHGSQILDKQNQINPGIPATCAKNTNCQYWTYGQVPSTIMDTYINDISWWNAYGSNNNVFPTTGIPSKYSTKYIIEAQPYDSTNYLSTYKIIAFVTNTETGQSITRQKMYFAKNAKVNGLFINNAAYRINDGQEYVHTLSNTNTCNGYTAYRAQNLNYEMFNVKNNDIIYIRTIWERYNSSSTPQLIRDNCSSSTIQGAKYNLFMPAFVGEVTWNGKTLGTEEFDDNPAVSTLDHFKSVFPKYAVQATLLKSNFNWWTTTYGIGNLVPNTAKWLFFEMRSLWVDPNFSDYTVAAGGRTNESSLTYCQTVNNNTRATWSTLSNRYNANKFEYAKWGWLSNSPSTCAAYTTYPTSYAWEYTSVPDAQLGCTSNSIWEKWTPKSQLMSVWCDGHGQDIYLKTQTGVRGADKRWPIESWYPNNQPSTSYVIKVQFAPQIPL